MAKRKNPAPKANPDRPEIRGDRVRALREARSWNQPELAHRAGIYSSDVSAIERGHREMRTNNFKRLVVALGTSADYLLGLTDSQLPAR